MRREQRVGAVVRQQALESQLRAHDVRDDLVVPGHRVPSRGPPADDEPYPSDPAENHLFVSGKLSALAETIRGGAPMTFLTRLSLANRGLVALIALVITV